MRLLPAPFTSENSSDLPSGDSAMPNQNFFCRSTILVRVPVANHTGVRTRPQKTRLARRLHAALRSEMNRAHATFGVPTVHREAVRRLPHRRGTHVATYTLDQLSSSRTVVTSSPDGPAYTEVDTTGGDLDVWTDRQGRVHQRISDAQ